MADGPHVVALNWSRREALLSNDELVPIANAFDECGEEVGDDADAVSFVAGPSKDGKWFAGSTREFGGGVH